MTCPLGRQWWYGRHGLDKAEDKSFHAHHCIVFVLISENMCALECHKVSCSVWEAMDKEGNNFCVNLALAILPPSTSLRGHTLFLTCSFMFLMPFGSYLLISRFLKRVTVTSSACVLISKTHSFCFLLCSESHYR